MGGEIGRRKRKRKEEEEKNKREEKRMEFIRMIYCKVKGLLHLIWPPQKLVPPRTTFSEIFGPTLKICSQCKWS